MTSLLTTVVTYASITRPGGAPGTGQRPAESCPLPGDPGAAERRGSRARGAPTRAQPLSPVSVWPPLADERRGSGPRAAGLTRPIYDITEVDHRDIQHVSMPSGVAMNSRGGRGHGARPFDTLINVTVSRSHLSAGHAILSGDDGSEARPWGVAQRPPRLLLTLLGDYWWQQTESLPSAALVALLAEFGVSDSAA